jgi:predicted nucleotidyltransferase
MISDIRETLWTSNKRARKLINQLHALGYVKPSSAYDGSWEVTIIGWEFALASAAKPINRATADRLIKEIIDRAQTVNADNKYLYKITKIHVFGSYLSGNTKVEDIKLVINIEQKEPDNRRLAELMMEKFKEALEAGRSFDSFAAGFFWAVDEIYMFLKHRSSAIQIIRTDEILPYVEYKTIWEEQCQFQMISKV